jgi:alkanesulfonate monooxygenase SsuD/methylene tetrahydromethanopterin reductase-like flavin-dependent oxidoreductase (luciferase family)
MTLRIFAEPQRGASYDDLLALARTAEELGFGAFFRSDHILKMRETPGTVLVTDAWSTLAGLARDTSTIRLGTLVSPVTFRHIGLFAVIAAQVDQMSCGRLDIGLGAGWYAAEHLAFGLPFPSGRERYDLLADQLAILHGVWSAKPGATFTNSGATASVEIAADTVRPWRHPHPPVVLGGAGRTRSAGLAARYADEYNVAFASMAETKEVHDRVRRACEQAGRDPGSLVYSAAQVLCCATNQKDLNRRAAAIGRDSDELRASGFAGAPAEILDKIGRFAEHGIERFYLQVLDHADLDHLRLVGAEVLQYAPGH